MGRTTRRRTRVRRGDGERGAYTAELAVGLPSLVFLALWGLWGVAVAGDTLRCEDASWSGARAAARGEPLGAVVAEARHAAPRGAEVVVRRATGTAEVRCAALVRFGGIGTVTVRSRSTAVTEDGSGPPGAGGRGADGRTDPASGEATP